MSGVYIFLLLRIWDILRHATKTKPSIPPSAPRVCARRVEPLKHDPLTQMIPSRFRGRPANGPERTPCAGAEIARFGE